MSSLQKFHRRTQSVVSGYGWPATAIGGGDSIHGFWLGDVSSNKLFVAPKSTEVSGYVWGSYGTARGANSATDGWSNSNTLASFGSAAHPAAYYCRTLTTGGYNTWYLPAKDEMVTMASNRSAMPFAIADSFGGSWYWSSTEINGSTAYRIGMSTAAVGTYQKYGTHTIRAVRR